MNEYRANLELVQDKDTEDRKHLVQVIHNDNRAAAALAAFKARQYKNLPNPNTGD